MFHSGYPLTRHSPESFDFAQDRESLDHAWDPEPVEGQGYTEGNKVARSWFPG